MSNKFIILKPLSTGETLIIFLLYSSPGMNPLTGTDFLPIFETINKICFGVAANPIGNTVIMTGIKKIPLTYRIDRINYSQTGNFYKTSNIEIGFKGIYPEILQPTPMDIFQILYTQMSFNMIENLVDIYDVCTLPEKRGTGTTRLILQNIIEFLLIDNPKGRFSLGVKFDNPDYEKAAALYLKSGFGNPKTSRRLNFGDFFTFPFLKLELTKDKMPYAIEYFKNNLKIALEIRDTYNVLSREYITDIVITKETDDYLQTLLKKDNETGSGFILLPYIPGVVPDPTTGKLTLGNGVVLSFDGKVTGITAFTLIDAFQVSTDNKIIIPNIREQPDGTVILRNKYILNKDGKISSKTTLSDEEISKLPIVNMFIHNTIIKVYKPTNLKKMEDEDEIIFEDPDGQELTAIRKIPDYSFVTVTGDIIFPNGIILKPNGTFILTDGKTTRSYDYEPLKYKMTYVCTYEKLTKGDDFYANPPDVPIYIHTHPDICLATRNCLYAWPSFGDWFHDMLNVKKFNRPQLSIVYSSDGYYLQQPTSYFKKIIDNLDSSMPYFYCAQFTFFMILLISAFLEYSRSTQYQTSIELYISQLNRITPRILIERYIYILNLIKNDQTINLEYVSILMKEYEKHYIKFIGNSTSPIFTPAMFFNISNTITALNNYTGDVSSIVKVINDPELQGYLVYLEAEFIKMEVYNETLFIVNIVDDFVNRPSPIATSFEYYNQINSQRIQDVSFEMNDENFEGGFSPIPVKVRIDALKELADRQNIFVAGNQCDPNFYLDQMNATKLNILN